MVCLQAADLFVVALVLDLLLVQEERNDDATRGSLVPAESSKETSS